MSLVTLILLMIGAVEIELLSSKSVGFEAIHLVVIISIGWIIQGAPEEFVTRGWMMNVPEKRYNTTFTVILSSSLFALLHLGNPNIDLISIINIILVGLVFYVEHVECTQLGILHKEIIF